MMRTDTLRPWPWVNKRGRIQLRAHRKKTIARESFLMVFVRTRAAHNGVPSTDRWEVVHQFPLSDDPEVTLREQARRYLSLVATLYGYPFEGTYEL